ncbi:MAG: M24 family metallopeptidase [Woeseiaceae bacterium]
MPRLNSMLICLCLSYALTLSVSAEPIAIADYPERPAVENRIVSKRLETLLPTLMREAGIDMWLVIAREYNDDPVFLSLVPKPRMTARRTTILMFHDRGDAGVERLTISRYPLGELYEAAWEGGDLDAQWRRLASIIAEKQPTRIGINVSDQWPVADGLSHGLHTKLIAALSDDDAAKLVSADQLIVRWMETRIPDEVEIWQRAVAIARHTIARAFSNEVVTPGVTTIDDVAWFIRREFEANGLAPWFQPDVNVQRPGSYDEAAPFFGEYAPDTIIRRGDILHTDVGLCYLALCTDTQEMGYVLRLGEHAAPEGLKNAMAVGNQWQDLLTSEFKTGRTGNEILAAAQRAMKRAGLDQAIYTHPLGLYGHAPGPTIGMWDNQGPTIGRGDWPLYANTGYAIEGNVKVRVPEFDNHLVQMKLEQSAFFDGTEVHYLADRQTALHIVR